MEITAKKTNKGFTLIEVLVAMTIFSVMVLFVTDIYISLSRFYLGSISNRIAQQNIKIAMETITRYAKQSTSAEWDGATRTLRLAVKDDSGGKTFVAFRNDTSGGNSTMKMGTSTTYPAVADQNLTSENLNITRFNIAYHPGVPALITIELSGRIENFDKGIERGTSGTDIISFSTSVALKNQYNY